MSDYVASTGRMVTILKGHPPGKGWTILTEREMGYRLRKIYPDQNIHVMDNAICRDMKRTTLQDLLSSLEQERYEVILPEEIMEKARGAIRKDGGGRAMTGPFRIPRSLLLSFLEEDAPFGDITSGSILSGERCTAQIGHAREGSSPGSRRPMNSFQPAGSRSRPSSKTHPHRTGSRARRTRRACSVPAPRGEDRSQHHGTG